MTICYRIRRRGKTSHDYEARYRRHGYNISVSALTLEDLKTRFIEVLHETENNQGKTKIPRTFDEFAMFYFENFRKRKVTQRTYDTDLRRYKKNILPILGNTPINKITPTDCQEVLDTQLKHGYERNAQDIYYLLNVIFKMAIAHGLIERNPLAGIQPITHEREHGKALSKKEERILLDSTKGTPYQLMFAIALYTGLRPNEYKTAKLENGFIVAVNSKRKNGKVEYKKIPITPMLEPYMVGVEEIKFYIPEVMRSKFNQIFPDHKLYDLRTTFYTRCQECGIADVARNVFVGHSLGKLGNTYTDLSDEFLLKEGKKFKY
ncbi:MAG: site-specific integrase [Candidatus Coproplasma sp.]